MTIRRVRAGVAAVMAGLLLASCGGGDDGQAGEGGTVRTSTTTAAGASTTASSTTVPGPSGTSAALWPFPGQPAFASPREAASTFAIELLRFEQPTVGEFEAGDSRSGEVPIRPGPDVPVVTTVFVRQLAGDDGWSVIGAAAEGIELDAPAAMAEVSSPVELRGRALAFEGHVSVEVRQDGGLGPIGSGFVTGGGDVLRPFSGSVAFETPGAPFGALVLFTTSAEDGRVWQAMAIRIAFRSTDLDARPCGGFRPQRPRPGSDQMEVKAYFTCEAADGAEGGSRPFPVFRLVDRSPRVLEASLRVLLAGPTRSERAGGVSSWFSDETAALLRSVRIGDGGHAVVDFGDLREEIPNASSSAGSAKLLAELDATVFQFRSVESVEYQLEGSCEAFNEWLQYGGCEPRARSVSSD